MTASSALHICRTAAALLLLAFTCLASAAGLAFSPHKIWIIEQGKDPYTQPYDGATSLPGLQVYRGIIRNPDGTPAAYAGFYAQVTPVVKSTRPVQVMTGGIEMNAGADGRFHYAIKGYTSNGIFMTGRDGDPRISRSQESFELRQGEENIIYSRLRADVAAQLILADGTTMTRDNIPSFDIGPNSQSPEHGSLKSLPPYKPYGDATLYEDRQSTTATFIIRSLAVPGAYTMKAMGRVFEPFEVGVHDTLITAHEVARPFSLSGTVQDALGEPVKDALVVIDNQYRFNMSSQDWQFSDVQQLWEETGGDFNKLGFYMARTDAFGNYSFSGHCIGNFSTMYIYADRYKTMVVESFLPPPPTTLNAIDVKAPHYFATTHTKTLPSFDAQMFEGDAIIPPIVTARTATVRLKLKIEGKVHPVNESGMFVTVAAPKLSTSGTLTGFWTTGPQFGRKGETLIVPAGIPFELVITPPKSNSSNRISVKSPLKPGEVRDLGVHELSLSGRNR